MSSTPASGRAFVVRGGSRDFERRGGEAASGIGRSAKRNESRGTAGGEARGRLGRPEGPTEPNTSAEVVCEVRGGLPQGGCGAWDIQQRVEQREVVDGAVVAHVGHVHPGLVELARVGRPSSRGTSIGWCPRRRPNRAMAACSAWLTEGGACACVPRAAAPSCSSARRRPVPHRQHPPHGKPTPALSRTTPATARHACALTQLSQGRAI